MARIIMTLCAMVAIVMASAETFSYRFSSTPLPKAIQRIMEDHPEVSINFIYDELENYTTSTRVHTDNVYDALRKIIALNPVTVVKFKNTYYVEALQHGKYLYKGRAVGSDSEPVAAATVMLLAPNDSTVLTYGITDADGRFKIPCDRANVIAKLSCMGYKTVYHQFSSFDVGTIIMPENAVELNAVTIEGDNAKIYTDRTVYVPTTRQKNASQTGADLLGQMAIPQLGMSSGSSIVTNAGKPVAVFIDFIPASKNDLAAMRISDVKRVEFYENPSDPRLQGNPYVVNFIMNRYEYGGYVKGYGHLNLVSLMSQQLLGNIRFQNRKMTYDLMGYGFNTNTTHSGSELTETYRLPQPDGNLKEFNRFSELSSSKQSNQQYFAAFKATYNSDNIQASSQINASITNTPRADKSGSVTYSPAAFPSSTFASTLETHTKYVAYSGYYFFTLPRGNSLMFTPSYTFSHTDQNSSYLETGYAEILNGAVDNTNELNGNLKFNHDFGKYGNLLGFVRGAYEYNRTRYSGSATSFDKAKSTRIGAGATYNVTAGNFYGLVGFGWDWDRLQFGNMVDRPSSPWFDLSLQYSFREKHSVSTTLHYSTWTPSPNFKSENIIQSTPLLQYTGNPNLVPSKSYDFEVNYNWNPSNNYSLSAFGWGWIVGDRYAYDYEATAEGVLRTIKQPIGSYAQGKYGVSGTARFLNRTLVFTGQVGQVLNHNGSPYNVNHTYIDWYARMRYYIGNWNFTFTYISDNASADGSMNGIWHYGKSDWYLTFGWSNSNWNVRADLINFSRWNWRNARQVMRSQYYDTTENFINGKSRAFIQLSATYTIGFGKKVPRDDEPSVSGSASSGILK